MKETFYQPKAGDTPNDQAHLEVTRSDLPLHCPLDRMRLWDSHPRVYLPLEKNGTAMCPYCGTRFMLVDSPSVD